ncbi:MAG: DUF167 domain-containing protein [Aquabacterium sp.]
MVRFNRSVPVRDDLVEIRGVSSSPQSRNRSNSVWLRFEPNVPDVAGLAAPEALRVSARDLAAVESALAEGPVPVVAWVVRAELCRGPRDEPPAVLFLQAGDRTLMPLVAGQALREEVAANARLGAWFAAFGIAAWPLQAPVASCPAWPRRVRIGAARARAFGTWSGDGVNPFIRDRRLSYMGPVGPFAGQARSRLASRKLHSVVGPHMSGARRVVQVEVRPGAGESALEERADGSFFASLRSPPVDGKANAELIALVARHFKVPKGAVTIRSGASARMTLVAVDLS